MIKPVPFNITTSPTNCPACGSGIKYYSEETFSEYEGWKFKCHALIIRDEFGKLVVEDDCHDVTKRALDNFIGAFALNCGGEN